MIVPTYYLNCSQIQKKISTILITWEITEKSCEHTDTFFFLVGKNILCWLRPPDKSLDKRLPNKTTS